MGSGKSRSKITGFDDLRIRHFKALVTKLPKGVVSVPEALRVDNLMPLDRDGLEKLETAKDIFDAVIDRGGWADSFFQLRSNQWLLQEIADLLIRVAQTNRFRPLQDEEVPKRLADVLSKWRSMASTFFYRGPVAWLVPGGVTLKKHIPKLGPCRDDFQYLRDWNFPDEPTTRSLAFWIPRVIPESRRESASGQLNVLRISREYHKLPDHHLSSFGPANLLAGLIFSHLRYSDEKVPLYNVWVSTDTLLAGSKPEPHEERLYLGDFIHPDSSRLNCQTTDQIGIMGMLSSAAFPLALETLMLEEFPELSNMMMRD